MIEEARAEYPEVSIKDLCELFSMSRSWYYERPTPEEKAHTDVELRDTIELIVLEFPGYGYRRVTAELRRRCWAVNHKRVLRIMREESLLCQLRRRFKVTTNSAHSFGSHPNLLKDVELDGPDQGWISDITYVRLPMSFCYLATILDAYSRLCVGWCLSRWIDTRLTLSALEMALSRRRPAVGLIHHSDQGVQYASQASTLLLLGALRLLGASRWRFRLAAQPLAGRLPSPSSLPHNHAAPHQPRTGAPPFPSPQPGGLLATALDLLSTGQGRCR